jgi:hypothetical protein
MARFLKITNYKIQITNKFQITMSEITNSPGGLKKKLKTFTPKAFKPVRRTPHVCNLGFVICNFPDRPDTFWFRLVRAGIRINPKHEIRNSKQIQVTKTKTAAASSGLLF